jgi:hypothetical protein
MKHRTAAILAAILLLGTALGAWRWATLHASGGGGILVAGGGGGLPRAAAGQEGFDEHALQAAADQARAQGASALLVMRHGHLVLEQYAAGADADALIAGGELGHALMRLAAGVALDRNGLAVPDLKQVDDASLVAAIAAASGLDYPQFLSRHLWRPLDAAPARWRDSALHARAVDWLRVAGLLLHDGRFEGTQVVPRGWVARLGTLPAPAGAEPFRAGEMFLLHGDGATLLWLSPRLDLLVLCVAAAPPPGVAVDETRLARMVTRSLRDLPATGGSSLNDLVPGH